MKQVLMTMFTFSAGAGGITRVLMNRGRMLREVGIDARIALFAWDPDLEATVAQLKRQGRLAPDQPVLNLYAHYAAVADGSPEPDGSPAALSNTGRPSGVRSKRERCDPITGHRQEETFLSPAGHCYLRKRFDASGSMLTVELNDPRAPSPFVFTRMQDLYTHWLSELARSNMPCAIIADAPKSAPIVLNVREKQVHRILTIHNNHFKAPYRYGAPLRDTYAGILQTFEQADALVVLTRGQRRHIEQQFGAHPHIHVIPNSVTVFPRREPPIERDPMLVVAVARYHKKKGLHKVIEAFKTVLRDVPGARLELYGAGDQEAALRALIVSMWLSHAVSLRGYAVDIASVFEKASVAVSASEFEGFGVGIVEALSLGAPVVSFDCPYGPGEIIRDGEDGYLVDDTKSLAEDIIDLLKNPAQARSMGEAGRRNMQRFSAQSVTAMWLDLFRSLTAASDAPQDMAQKDMAQKDMAPRALSALAREDACQATTPLMRGLTQSEGTASVTAR